MDRQRRELAFFHSSDAEEFHPQRSPTATAVDDERSSDDPKRLVKEMDFFSSDGKHNRFADPPGGKEVKSNSIGRSDPSVSSKISSFD